MNNRNYVRYDSEFFPVNMREVSISWEGSSPIVSNVVNYSAHGIRVSIPALLSPPDIPKKKDIVRVHMPIGQLWFTGLRIFAVNELDGSVSMGIHFYKPEEQNHLKELMYKSLNAPSPLDHFVSYEWEERVARLCNSEDPKLKKIGEEKLRSLRQKGKGEPYPAIQ